MKAGSAGNFEIKLDESCISNPKSEICDRTARAIASPIRDFGFEMQDSSNFKISYLRVKCRDSSSMLVPPRRRGKGPFQDFVILFTAPMTARILLIPENRAVIGAVKKMVKCCEWAEFPSLHHRKEGWMRPVLNAAKPP